MNLSPGGVANWTALTFEVRVATDFSVHMMLGEHSGLSAGQVVAVQPQAPLTVDDILVRFASGAKWGLQVKSGSLGVQWAVGKPFADGLRQLFVAANTTEFDLSPHSNDRLELVVSSTAKTSVNAFATWLDKARRHVRVAAFLEACVAKSEQALYAQVLKLLAPADSDLLFSFLRHLYVRRLGYEDQWRQGLCQLLSTEYALAINHAEAVIRTIERIVIAAAPSRGEVTAGLIQRSLAQNNIYLRSPHSGSFVVSWKPDVTFLKSLLAYEPIPGLPQVHRPELDAAEATQGVRVLGTPGSGKSNALADLACARSLGLVIIIRRGFSDYDAPTLASSIRRSTPYALIWDDIHLDVALFVRTAARLLDSGHIFTLFCSCRQGAERTLEVEAGASFWQRLKVAPWITLQALDRPQIRFLLEASLSALRVSALPSTMSALEAHVLSAEATPLCAITMCLCLHQSTGGRELRNSDIWGLPATLLDGWRALFDGLNLETHAASLLRCFRFLLEIGAGLELRLAAHVFTELLDYRDAELENARERLARDGWIGRSPGEARSHNVPIAAVGLSESLFGRIFNALLNAPAADERSRGELLLALQAHCLWRVRSEDSQSLRVRAASRALAAGITARALLRQPRDAHLLCLANLNFASAGMLLAECDLDDMTLEAAAASIDFVEGCDSAAQRRRIVLDESAKAARAAVQLVTEKGLRAALLTTLANVLWSAAKKAPNAETHESLYGEAMRSVQEAVRLGAEGEAEDPYISALLGESIIRSERLAMDRADMGDPRQEAQHALLLSEKAVSVARSAGSEYLVSLALINSSNRQAETARYEQSEASVRAYTDRAIAYIDEGLGWFRLHGWMEVVARTLTNRSSRVADLAALESRVKERCGLRREAVELIEEAVRIGESNGFDNELGNACAHGVSRLLESRECTSEAGASREYELRALEYAWLAFEIAKRSGDAKLLIRRYETCCRAIGEGTRDSAASERLYQEGDGLLTIMREYGPQEEAIAASLLAGALVESRGFEESVVLDERIGTLFSRAIPTLRTGSDRSRLATALCNYSLYLKRSAFHPNLDEARQLLLEAVTLFRQGAETVLEAQARLGLASTWIAIAETASGLREAHTTLETAARELREAQKLIAGREYRSPLLAATILARLSETQYLLGLREANLERGRAYFSEAARIAILSIERAREIGDSDLLMESMTRAGGALDRRATLAAGPEEAVEFRRSALAYFEEAVSVAEGRSDPDIKTMLVRNVRNMIVALAVLGDPQAIERLMTSGDR